MQQFPKDDINDKNKFEIIDTNYIFKGKIMNVKIDTVILEDGKPAKREVVEHGKAVCIIPVDTMGNVYLVLQYRHPFGCVILEAPAGLVEKDEEPLQCAIRELREEIDAVGDEFIYLGEIFPSPGYVNEIIHLYFTRIKAFAKGQLDEDEFLTVKVIPFSQLIEMINNNEIKDAKTIIGALRVQNLYPELTKN